MIYLTLPYPISANRYWKNFKGRVVVSKDAAKYKHTVRQIAMAAGIRSLLSGRIAVQYTLFPHRPKDWEKRMKKDPVHWDDTVKCIDLDNAQKVMFDALQNTVFDNDRNIRSIHASRGIPDEKGARIEIVIRSY
jgi:crossover junction endodeoxyribonuclease RusA